MSKHYRKTYPDSEVAVVDSPQDPESLEPSDEELLAGFHSVYAKYPADQILRVNNSARKAGDLLEVDRSVYLQQRRRALAQTRAEEERTAEAEAQKRAQLEAAFRLEARPVLARAVSDYERWKAKADELRDALGERQNVLDNLLANQGAEIDLEALRKVTAEVGNCRLLVDALQARLAAWLSREAEYCEPLQAAIRGVTTELILLHESERMIRVREAKDQIEAVINVQHLRDRHYGHLGGGSLPELTESAYPVIELDGIIQYHGGRYLWNYPSTVGSQLLVLAGQLEERYALLVPMIRGLR